MTADAVTLTTPRKILLVCAAYPPNIKGGGEKSTQILAQSLSAIGHTVCVLTLADAASERWDSDGTTRIQTLRSPNIYWNFHPHASMALKLVWHLLDNFNPRAIRQVAGAIRAFAPDIVMSSTLENFGPAIWQACAREGVPVVHILRSYYIRCLRGSMFFRGNNCPTPCLECSALTLGRRHATPLVQGVVGISQFITDQHASLFPKAQLTVIPNAVHPVPPVVRAVRREAAPVVFGYLGRLEPEKGIADILEVFQHLPSHCQLVVAGTGKPGYVENLQRQYASERIRFLGWVTAESVYPQLDFVVIPSLWNEPFGRVVIEAFAHGVPVIAAARGGLSELVAAERTGYLFNPAQPDGLRAACLQSVRHMHTHPCMAQAARQESSRYLPATVAQQYGRFFTQILHG